MRKFPRYNYRHYTDFISNALNYGVKNEYSLPRKSQGKINASYAFVNHDLKSECHRNS